MWNLFLKNVNAVDGSTIIIFLSPFFCGIFFQLIQYILFYLRYPLIWRTQQNICGNKSLTVNVQQANVMYNYADLNNIFRFSNHVLSFNKVSFDSLLLQIFHKSNLVGYLFIMFFDIADEMVALLSTCDHQMTNHLQWKLDINAPISKPTLSSEKKPQTLLINWMLFFPA